MLTLLTILNNNRKLVLLTCVALAIAGYVAMLNWQLDSARSEVENKTMLVTKQQLEMDSLRAEVARVNANALAEQERLKQSLAVIDKLNVQLKNITGEKVRYIKSVKTNGTCKEAMDLLRNKGVFNAEKATIPN